MKKKELKEAANVSSASLAKLAKGENIQTDVLLRICEALDVELNDIVDTVRD
ncbi:MAG: helix-turn-helix domain-containing protein [Prevotellaceae bacterium]|nr:helix-turn-helix domain-containing protein [Prevotellaceae bacterium]